MLKSTDFTPLCQEIFDFLGNKKLISIQGSDNCFTCIFEKTSQGLFISTAPHLSTCFLIDTSLNVNSTHPLAKWLNHMKLIEILYNSSDYIICLVFQKDTKQIYLWIKFTHTTAGWMLTDSDKNTLSIEHPKYLIKTIPFEKKITNTGAESKKRYSETIKNTYFLRKEEELFRQEKKRGLNMAKKNFFLVHSH